MGKEQYIKVTDGSLALAVLYSIVSIVEDYAEETDTPLSSYSVSWRLIDALRTDPRALLGERIVVYSSEAAGEHAEAATIAGESLTIVIEPGYGEASFESLYSEPPRLLALDKWEIKSKADITTRTGIEYIFYYLADGRVAVFEGEHYRVRLPFVESASIVHTHPEGACGLSRADVESALDLLVSGGLMSGAATLSCLAFMLRRGLVAEDDYFAVKEALYRGDLGRLQELRLKTIVFGVTPY